MHVLVRLAIDRFGSRCTPFIDVLPSDVLATLLAALARRGTPVAPPPKGSVGRTLRQEIVEAAEAARTRAAAVCDAPPFGALRPC